jgi:ATP-binding cassette subfamily B protein
MTFSRPLRRFFAPEVVQTSAMDCGPATLKCLLEGFGIRVSYGRLREACQTDVDGTSIDTIEEIAGQLGLEAEQTVLPVDHLLLEEAAALPALVVVRQPNGLTHFVVAWRRHGPFLQLMDPGTGRRWTSSRSFLNELFVHEAAVPAASWRSWAGGDELQRGLRRRLAELRVPEKGIVRLFAAADADAGWHGFAALDAATRMVTSLVEAGGLNRGEEAARVIEVFVQEALAETANPTRAIPKSYWSVREAPATAEGEGQVFVRGAVLIRVMGRKKEEGREERAGEATGSMGDAQGRLSSELVAALAEAPVNPARELFRMLRADGLLAPAALMCALLLAAGSVVLEAVLLRGLFDLGRDLTVSGQRLGAMLGILGFAGVLLLLELPVASMSLRLGRRLETRLRVAFLEKLPRLVDRYFQSRLMSDMAERSHAVQTLRGLPDFGARLARTCFELVFTALGIIWLDPASWPVVVLATIAGAGLPLLTNPLLIERDLRVRTHVGALGRFYLDALLGLVAIRTHGAERTVRSEHEGLLVEWARAGFGLQRMAVLVEGVQAFLGFALGVWLLFGYLSRTADASGVLLLVYWALNLPVLAEEIALLARQYPGLRSVTLRLLEPLGAPEESGEADRSDGSDRSDGYAAVRSAAVAFRGVRVRAGGHLILEDITFNLRPGEHVAIVGPSGAGKSSLVGLLLGWHRPAAGELLVDSHPLGARQLEQLRRCTTWVDPTVHLWNRSLLENLCYGANGDATARVGQAVQQADLLQVLRRFPDGLQTRLGDSGALVSGGEGQRVRFGRALLRGAARLVILDEPFRGLDRAQRALLMERARAHWEGATLLCITHDIGETMRFDRVLVIEGGRLVEDGAPTRLAQSAGGRYAALLMAEKGVREHLWSGNLWRRHRLEEGKLVEATAGFGVPPFGGSGLEMTPNCGILGAEPPKGGTPNPNPRSQEMSGDWEKLSWPASRLGEAIEWLARRTRLPVRSAEMKTAAPGPQDPEAFDAWLDAAAGAIGLEVEPVETSFAEVDGLVKQCGPALIQIRLNDQSRFLAVIGGRRRVKLLGPDLAAHSLDPETIRSVLCHQLEGPLLAETKELLERSGVAPDRRASASAAIVRHQLGGAHMSGEHFRGWLLRLPPGASLWRLVREAGVPSRVSALLGAHAAQYLLWLLSWWMIGQAALQGHFDWGWLTAWALVLLSMIPFRLLVTWWQGALSIRLGALLKRRLLFGALQLQSEEIRHQGAGQLLGCVIESEAVESLALSGGFLGMMAALELALAAAVMAVWGPAGIQQVLLLVAWTALTLVGAWQYFRRRQWWTESRLKLTNDLVERMVGHRTRLAQEAPHRWHEGEDESVSGLLALASGMDRRAIWLTALVPRGWLLLGLLGLTPAFAMSNVAPASLAVGLGGVLLAFRAFQRLAAGVSNLAGAAIAWQQVRPILRAAGRRTVSNYLPFGPAGVRPSPGAATSARKETPKDSDALPLPELASPQDGRAPVLLEAHSLNFSYRDRGLPVLRECNLKILAGDRIMLEGPSGGGKSTLASMLAGLRTPDSGLLLLSGLDRQTIGLNGWRRHVVAAPQFHENHVLTGTFAFNLLMGRQWPPSEEDFNKAQQICHELGLEDLLRRMPAGLLQVVGETGWQLSHGEKSRLYLARALLQNAQLIILDESFAALDPGTLQRALQCAITRAPTLLVIAHP